MNSFIYECDVMHHRLIPRKNSFAYKIFMFLLDLDELDELCRKYHLLSHNKFNWFSFRDRDHARIPGAENKSGDSVKSKIITYLQERNIQLEGGRIMLLTHLRTLGHIFNPVSFYFCFDSSGRPVCAVSEVCNTFGEVKLYLLPEECRRDDGFDLKIAKNFYVSPFSSADTAFNFILKIPAEKLNIKVNNYAEGKLSLLSSLTGNRKDFSNASLSFYALKFPFITLKIIILIHWQALLLYCKGAPYFRKKAQLHLQQQFTKN